MTNTDKWCPFVQLVVGPQGMYLYNNRGEMVTPDYGVECIEHRCAAWNFGTCGLMRLTTKNG